MSKEISLLFSFQSDFCQVNFYGSIGKTKSFNYQYFLVYTTCISLTAVCFLVHVQRDKIGPSFQVLIEVGYVYKGRTVAGVNLNFDLSHLLNGIKERAR